MCAPAKVLEVPAISKLLLTMREACVALSISKMTLYKLLEDGELESRWIGAWRYVTADSICAYIKRGVDASRDASGKLIKDTGLDGFRGKEGKAKKAARLAAESGGLIVPVKFDHTPEEVAALLTEAWLNPQHGDDGFASISDLIDAVG
jgi:excisionase family DNA binding protein